MAKQKKKSSPDSTLQAKLKALENTVMQLAGGNTCQEDEKPHGLPVLCFNQNTIEGVNANGIALMNTWRTLEPSESQIISEVKEWTSTPFPILTLKNHAYRIQVLSDMHEMIFFCAVDVSELIATERQLISTKSFYEQVLFHLPADVVVLSAEGKYLFVNPQSISNPDTRRWIIGKTNQEYGQRKGLDATVVEKRQKLFEKACKTFKKQSFEERFVLPDGSVKYYLRNMIAIPNQIGEVEFVLGYGIEISDLKKAQQEIKEHEEKYKFLLETASDVIFKADHEGKFTYVNSVGSYYSGLTTKQLIGMPYYLLIREDWRERVVDFYQNQRKQKIEESYFEFPIVHLDGREFWMGQNVKVLRHHGEVIGFHAVARDITKLKNAEDNLEAIINSLDDIVMEISEDFRFLNVWTSNDAMLAYPREVFLEKTISEVFGEVHGKKFEKMISETVRQKTSQSLEYQIPGMTQWFKARTHVIKTERDLSPKISLLIQDITEKKKAEFEILAAQKLAEESSKTKDLFLANMSHEMRTPMNAIIGFTHLLQKTGLTSQQLEFLNGVKISAENLLEIINSILDLTQIDSGKIRLEHVNFSIKDIIKAVMQAKANKAEARNIQLIHNWEQIAEPENGYLGDPGRLHQILLHLVDNAIKFTESGSVTLSCDILENNDSFSLIKFQVKDTGIGIDTDKIDDIFDVFTQADISTTRKYGGIGIGLPITRKLVQMLGGDIWVKSQSGEGTEFNFVLKFKKANQAEVKTHSITEPSSFKGKKVLVVEDNEINKLFLTNLLKQWDISYSTAYHGKEALQILENESIDLILMDIMMPVMDGLTATRIIREELKLDIPIVVVSANAFAEEKDKAEKLGANAYLVKPLDPDALLAQLNHYLGNANVAANEVISTPFGFSKLLDMSNQDVSFVRKMASIFVEQLPDDLHQLQTHCTAKNWAQTRAVAHRMKPSLQYFEMTELWELIKQIELLAKEEQDVHLLPELIQKFTRGIEQTIPGFKEAMEQL